MSRKQPGPKACVELRALSRDGTEVANETMGIEDYYDASPELIDSPQYRTTRGIRSVVGKIYDPKGKLDQQFENRYGADGALEWTRVVHADGQVIEETIKKRHR